MLTGPVDATLRHILNIDPAAALFDIGCNYGREAIRIVNTARAAGSDSTLYMFDPGVAGKLALLNMQLNELSGYEYYDTAVADIDGHMLLHVVDGQSQDNKLINRSEKAVSVPVKAMTLASFVKDQNIDASACFVKCDTQGAELEVLRGFRKSSLYRNMAGIFEFFPGGLATRIKPQEFARQLCEEFIVADLGAHRRFFEIVTPDNIEALMARVEKFDPPFTDLLLVARSLPGAGSLIEKLNYEHENVSH